MANDKPRTQLPDPDELAGLKNLETFLKPRVEAAEQGRRSRKSVDDIFDEVRQEDTMQ